jgi:plastocyanin
LRAFIVAIAAFAILALPALSSASTRTTTILHLSAPVSGLRYTQKTLHAHPGRIKIIFVNNSTLKHNVNVELGEKEFGKSATIAKGTTSVTVTLKAGKYNYYCSVPGHEDAGMHGTLTVS